MQSNKEITKDFYNTKDVLSVDQINFPSHPFVLIASARRSGKSVLMRDLVFNMLRKSHIDFLMLFSQTAVYEKEYGFLSQEQIRTCDHLEEDLEKIMKYQENNKKSKKEVNGLILLDDVILTNRTKKLVDLSSLGRHLNITVIASVQYPRQFINAAIRNNLDMIFFNQLNMQSMEAVYDATHTMFKFREFYDFANENNDDYKFILYQQSDNKHDKLKLVKARIYKNLKLEHKNN